MESSMKRHLPVDVDDRQSEKSKKGKQVAEEPPVPPPPPIIPRVVLNPADCDLDFDVQGDDGTVGSALCEEGFGYCWSGARANVGIWGGMYYFGCKIIAHQGVNIDDTPSDEQNLCRIGISVGNDPVGSLGETGRSFALGDTGSKFPDAGTFFNYRERIQPGDTIIFFVNLVSEPCLISFSKNGKWLGIGKEFYARSLGVANFQSKGQLWESALFPHILLKNVSVQMLFSAQDGPVPPEAFKFKPWSSAFEDRKGILGPTFQNVRQCEAIMMVGLPGSGKSAWAENWVKNHPEKRYILLGTELVLNKMKLVSLFGANNYTERLQRMMDSTTNILNTLLSRASNMPRNFIIDQENVNKNVRRSKLQPFANYNKIAVVVFPIPEEYKKRAQWQKRLVEMGRQYPSGDINQMLAEYTLPDTDELFDKVLFPELGREESERCLAEMKRNQTLFQEVYQKSS